MFSTRLRFHSNVMFFFLSIGFLLALPPSLPAAEQIGVFSKVEGNVDVMRNGALPAIAARTGSPVMVKDFIRTKSNARAEVEFTDGSILKIAPRTRIDINEYLAGATGDARKLALPRGKVEAVVKRKAGGGQPQRFEIRTPNAVAGVRGTDFFVFHDRNTTGVLVKEGTVYTFNPRFPDNVVNVPAGTSTSVSERTPPAAPRPASANELKLHEKDVALPEKSGRKEGASKQPSEQNAATGEAQAADGAAGQSVGTAPVSSPDSTTPDSTSGAIDTGGSAESSTAVLAPDLVGSSSADAIAGMAMAMPPASLTPDSQLINTFIQPPSVDPVTPPPVTETVAPEAVSPIPLFTSVINAVPMSRDTTYTNGLLTIIPDAPFKGVLQGFQPLWANSSIPLTLAGDYPQVSGSNHYWMGKVDAAADNGVYAGFMGGVTLDSALSLEGRAVALYIDPAGKTGIIKASFAGGINAGWTASGTLSRIEVDATGTGIVPSSLSPGWWDPKVTSDYVALLAPPVIVQLLPNTIDDREKAEGFMVDSNLDISRAMSDRGDVLQLSYLKAAPSFGIWQRESFGRFKTADTNFVLVTNADLGVNDTVTNRWISDNIIQVLSFGQWQSGGKLLGTDYGFWGDWQAGAVRLLTGELLGAYNTAPGTFGAVSTGSWLDVATFINNPSLAGQLGFPTIQRPTTFTLAGSNAQGSTVTIPNLKFYSYSAGDPIGLWVATGVDGNYVGTLENQTFSLSEGTGNLVRGDLRIVHAGASPLSGKSVWLGEIFAQGELNGPFRSTLDGVAAGTYDQTTSKFIGVAAGTSHPLSHLSLIDSSTTPLLHYSTGGYLVDGRLTGLMGGMSFWNASQGETEEMQMIGVHSSPTLNFSNYTFSTDIISRDIPTGTNTTADGGAYAGFITGAYSWKAQYPDRTVVGRISALYLDPYGKAGILTGEFDGHLDMQGYWDAHGKHYPVKMADLLVGGVTAANFTGSIAAYVVSSPAAVPGGFTGLTSSITPAVATENIWEMKNISGVSDWGISRITLSGTYSSPAVDRPWDLPVDFSDTTRLLSGVTMGDIWSSANGKLHGVTYAHWADMAPAVPATGIYVGETIGTFDPVAFTWQSMTSGAWLETTRFLQMAATPAGQAALQQLNIPAVEIGSANFSGTATAGADSLSVTMNNVKFFAPTNGARPVIWASGNVTGTYTGTPSAMSVPLTQAPGGANASGLAPVFAVQQWSGGKWRAQVNGYSPSATVGAHTGIGLSGTAAGAYGAGSISGTAAGRVK